MAQVLTYVEQGSHSPAYKKIQGLFQDFPQAPKRIRMPVIAQQY